MMDGIEIQFTPQGMIITPHVEGEAPGFLLTIGECLALGIDVHKFGVLVRERRTFWYEWTEDRIPTIGQEAQ